MSTSLNCVQWLADDDLRCTGNTSFKQFIDSAQVHGQPTRISSKIEMGDDVELLILDAGKADDDILA